MPGSPRSGSLLRQRLRELWHDDRSTRTAPLLCAVFVLAVLWLATR
jgi:hypothetical protein